jgi:RHS repeat-associated protein
LEKRWPRSRTAAWRAGAVAILAVISLVGASQARADTAPSNTAPPTIDGLATIGQTLHASPGTWSGTSPTFAYQWQDCGGGATYAGEVNADTPTAYWRLGEAAPATTAVDEKGGANGTYAGAPTLGATGLLSAPGETSTAVSFDGVNDLVSTPLTNTTAQLGRFSLEAWVKRNGAPAATQTIAAANGTFLRISTGASTASFGFWNGSSSQVVSTTASVVDNAAHHVVGTWDGTTLRIYLDGALASFLVPTGTPSALTDAFTIGDVASGTSWFAGTIDEVAFYRTTLAATRVKAHFDRGTNGCIDLAGATNQDFVIPPSAAGHSYRVVVTATNLASSASAASARTSTVTLAAPSNDVAPTVDGTYAQGQTLTGSDGQWSGSLPINFSRSWLRCGYFHEVVGLSPQPTSYWRLADLPGTTAAVDASGHGHTGLYHHYPTMGVAGALNGDPNTAVSFNGTDNYLSDGSNAYPTGSAAASVSFWFITPRMPASNAAATVLAGYPGLQVKLAGLGKLQINSTVSPTVLSANTWYHVVAVDAGGGGALKLYVNGQLDALSGNASAAKAGGEFDVGGSSTTATLTTIDEVAAFPSALNATQAQSLYSAGINESPPDGCTAISGAIGTSYQVQQADEQSKLSYQVTAQNSAGSATASSPEHIVRSPGPTNLDPPAISGTPTVGQQLTVSNGSWDGSPTSYGYQWERCGYRDAVLADHPLGYWRLGDVARKFVGDSSGNNNTGTYGAGVTGTAGALRGDGDGGFVGGTVSIPSSGALTPAGAFSIEEWLKPSTDSLPIVVLAKEGGDWQFRLESNKPKFDVQNASFVHSTATSSVALTDAAHWYHLVAVYTGSQAQVYVDGVQTGTGTTISGKVRTDNGGALTFDGTAGPVDEAAFYTTANGLSSGQITAHLNAAPCTDITGAITQSYTLTAADAGKWLSAIVTAQNGQGSSSASSTTTLASGSTAPTNTVRPTVSDPAEDARQVTNPDDDTVQIGDVLSATDGTWSPTSGLTFTRQWQRCGYAAAVLTDNPAGYWPVNEPAGPRAADVTGNNNDGTYGGAPLFGLDGALADGADTGIRVSDRADNVTTAASASLNLGTVFTAEAWVRRNTADGLTLFDKGQAGIGPTDPKGLIFKISADGTLSLGQSLGNTIAFSSPGAVPKDGRWHYVVGTDTGNSTGHLYVDGASVPATTDNTQPISLMPNNGLAMAKGVGDVDELAIYPTALSATRIQAHYAAGQAPCTDITGANGSSYTAASGDVGQSLRIKVTAAGSGGTTIAASNGSDPVVQQGGLGLDSPHDGATVRTTTPTLAMVPVANNATTQYEFEAATDALFNDNRQNSGWLPAGNPTFTVPASWKLKDGEIWYWHARTKSASAVVSPWTTVWSFHVQVNVLGADDAWSMAGFGALSVNKLNGNLLLIAPAPSYPTTTSSLTASLTYNSLQTKDTGFGKGWVLSSGADGSQAPTITDLNLATEPQDAAQVDWPDGHTTIYGHIAGSNDFRSPPGDDTRLYKNDDGTWTLTTPAGDVYSYGTDLSVSSYQATSPIPGQAPLTYSYSSGKPTKIADQSGRALTFTWHSLNATGCPSAILCLTGPDGITWQYVGSGAGGTSGALARINNGVRDLLAIGYDGSGRINKLQNANDLNPGAASPGYDPTHSVQVGYDGSGRVTSIDDGPNTGQVPSHSIWTFAYSTANVQTDATRAAHSGIAVGTQRTAVSSTTVYAPNQYGASSPVGTTTYYDEFNRAIEIKDPLGHFNLSGFTLKGQLLWSEDEAGNGRDNTYDAVTNQLTGTTSPDPSSTSGSVTTRYRYDEAAIGTASSSGQPTPGLAGTYFKNKNRAGRGDAQRTDATIDFDWGAGGPSILGGQSDNFSVRWTGYLNVGQTGDYVLSSVEDGGTSLVLDGYTVISDLSANGLHTKSSQSIHLKAGLHPLTLEYTDTTGSAEVHLRWRCANCATPISTQVIPSSALRPDYANRTSVVTPGGAVSYSHFAVAWRRLADYRQQQAGSTDIVTSYRYDSYGRLIEKVMPKGNSGRTIDSDGDLTGAVDARYATDYVYYGDVETAARPAACGGGSAVAQAGQLKSTTPYGIHPTTFVYDIAGHLVSSTNGAGTTCNTYDNEGSLTQQLAPGESQPTIYSYDPSGTMRTAANAAGMNTLTYDEFGRLTTSTDSFGAQASYAYDADGNVVLRRVAAGSLSTGPVYSTSYGYDADDRRTTLIDPAGRNYTFTYTSSDQLKATQYPNGTFSWNDYTRDGQVKAVYNRHGTLPAPLPATVPADSIASPIADYTSTLNVDGRKTQEVRSGGGLTTETTGYGYDGLGRLATVSLPNGIQRTYSYDRDSNRTAIVENGQTVATYTYDPTTTPGMDELTSITRSGQSTGYSYSSSGNTTARGSDVLTWDGRGRLSGGTFSGTSVSYSFDALGFRRARTTGGQTTRYLLGGLFETTSTGTVTGSATDGVQGDLIHYAGPPATGTAATFLYYNGHGDLAAEVDQAGSRTAAYTYDPFGSMVQAPAPNTTSERWTARWDKKLDTASGLVEMGARAYDPGTGRFLSVDPVDGGSLNNYDYAGQDSVNSYDLDGQDRCGLYGSRGDLVFWCLEVLSGEEVRRVFAPTLDQRVVELGAKRIVGLLLSRLGGPFYFPISLINGIIAVDRFIALRKGRNKALRWAAEGGDVGIMTRIRLGYILTSSGYGYGIKGVGVEVFSIVGPYAGKH